jgi:enterochelin esterase family protein
VDELVEARLLPPLHIVLPGVGNSWYVDGPKPHGPMATALLNGLMPAVEQALAPEAAWRAVIGLSMGGFGALHLGLRQPERWHFVGALSPAIFIPGSDFPGFQLQLFSGAFGDPFDRARFEDADPFTHVPALAKAVERPELYLSCGIDDFFGLATGTRAFGGALAEAAVPATVLIKPGRHDWPFWRAELPAALAALGSTVS